MEQKLIEEIRRHPYIFDKKLKLYRNLTVKTEAWQNISAAVGEDVERCQKRWKSLRDTFVKQLAARKSGNNANISLTWSYMEQLSFLLNHVAPRRNDPSFAATIRAQRKRRPSEESVTDTSEEESERADTFFHPEKKSKSVENLTQKRCGEVFLTTSGNIILHCTLCEKTFKDFQIYAGHIKRNHISNRNNTSEEVLNYDQTSPVDPLETDLDNIESPFDAISNQDESDEDSFDEFSSELDETTDVLLNTDTPVGNSRPYKCPQCDFACNNYTNLQGHIKRHSNNKPHKCSYCPKAFYERSELKRHTNRHLGVRPYLCSHCGHAFTTSSELSSHALVHTDIRTEECNFCEKKFYNKTSLRNHMVVHSDDRPYQCSFCNANFKLRKTLKSHMQIHENKRGYRCQFCSAQFNQAAGLHSHLKSSHLVCQRPVDTLKTEENVTNYSDSD